MSVALNDSRDWCGIWHDLGGDPELQPHLKALAAANIAAYCLSYGDSDDDVSTEIEWPVIDAPNVKTEGWRPPVKAWVRNVAYNCVSQNGVDFAPRAALEAITRAALEVDMRESAAAAAARETREAKVFGS